MKTTRLTIFLVMLMAGTPGLVSAEDWQFILEFDSAPDIAKGHYQRITRLHVDNDSIFKDGEEFTLVWKKLIFKDAYTGRYGKQYKYTTERWVMRCKDREMALVENALFDENDERIGHKVVTEDQLNFFTPVAGSRQAQGMLYTCSRARKIEKQSAPAQAKAGSISSKKGSDDQLDAE